MKKLTDKEYLKKYRKQIKWIDEEKEKWGFTPWVNEIFVKFDLSYNTAKKIRKVYERTNK